MENIKSKVLPIIIVLFILFLGFNYVRLHMLISVWTGPGDNEVEVYRLVGDDRILTYAFMPNNKLISLYAEGDDKCFQLGTIKGAYGNKVIWRLWYVNLPGNWLSYRIYEEGYEPVGFEYDAEVNAGSPCEVFPKQGSRTYFTAQFSQDSMKVSGMTLTKQEVGDVDFSIFETIQQTLEGKNEKPN